MPVRSWSRASVINGLRLAPAAVWPSAVMLGVESCTLDVRAVRRPAYLPICSLTSAVPLVPYE